MRAPFQVLAYRAGLVGPEVAVLLRADSVASACWQFVAGGGEDAETPAEAAARELEEELGVQGVSIISLGISGQVPVTVFGERPTWPAHLTHLPEYAFAARIAGQQPRLSHEHTRLDWLSAPSAAARLTWDSNRAALQALLTYLS